MNMHHRLSAMEDRMDGLAGQVWSSREQGNDTPPGTTTGRGEGLEPK